MAFPSTPTNGQIAVVGGMAYQYASTPNSWSRILSSANIITANVISVDTFTANTLNVNNNLYNIAGNISATGNVTGNYILGNGSLLTGIAGGGGTSIANGTSNITITSSGGNATVNIGGTANVAVFATTGEYVTGVVSASGNVTGGNLLTGGLISATGALTVTGSTFLANVSAGNIDAGTVYSGGNITTNGQISAAGNIITNGQISAAGNVTANNGMFTTIVNVASHTGAVVSVTGNVTGGNVVTGGLISATGNVSSGASINTVNLSVSGNVLGNLLPSANVTFDLGSASQMWRALYVSGNTIVLGSANLSVSESGLSVGNNPVVTVSPTGTSNTTGNMNVIGNVTGSNVTTTGSVSATGNITGGNIRTTGVMSVTGNITAGNVSATNFSGLASSATVAASANAVAGANVSGQVANALIAGTVYTAAQPNITSVGTLTSLAVTGNISGGNLLTGGLISATGNVTANNGMFTTIVNTASHTGAVVSVTGNITGGNVSGTALTGTLATAAQTNITSVGTLGVLAVSGNVTAGNVTAGSGVSVPSGSVLFNGTTQYLTAPTNSAFALGTGDFTVEAWTNFSSVAASQYIVDFRLNSAAGSNQAPALAYQSSSGKIIYISGDAIKLTGTTTIAANVWYHVALVRTSGTTKLYVNGILNGTVADSGSYINYANRPIIGAFASGANTFMSGYISNVRIVKGVAVYTANFTPSISPLTSTQLANVNGSPSAAITGTSTSLLLNTANGAGFLTDSSTNNFTVTNTGTATSNSLAPFVNTSGTVTATTGLFITSVNTASFTGTTVSVTGNVTGNYFVGNGSLLTGIAGGSGGGANIANGTSNITIVSSGGVATVNIGGTANVAVFATTGEYVTGLISATGNITGGNVSGTALTGTLATAAQTNITSVGTLGVLAVSGNVTANNGMFTNIVNVASHTGAVVSVSGSVTGANVIATTAITSGSILFNGTTQYLTVPSAISFSGDFTVEAWVYWAGGPTFVQYAGIISNRSGTGTFAPMYIGTTTGRLESGNWGVSGYVASALAITAGAWNHVALVRSGSTMRFYINGVQDATTGTVSGTLTASNLTIGSTAIPQYWNGYITNVRLVQAAVYTSTFTVPISPFTTTQSANLNGTPSAAIVSAASTSLLLNTVNNASYLADSSTNNYTITNVGGATSNSTTPTWLSLGAVTATYGIFTTSVNTASFTGAVVSVTGNITGGNVTTAGVLTVNSGAAATAIVNGASNAVGNIGSSGTYFNRLFAQATTALYADLAEVYKADAEYPSGTVLVFGGNQEVTISTGSHDTRIAGVVSTNPAHVMNSGLVSEFTVEVGLIGRVPCQVIGPVAVGDRVVSSSQAGVAERLDMQHYQPGVIIGKAVESYNGTGVGTIEVVVGRL